MTKTKISIQNSFFFFREEEGKRKNGRTEGANDNDTSIS